MKIKDEYTSLLETGELLEIFPELSGSWAKDRSKFTVLWEKNIAAIKNIDVNFDEYE